jgi:hypothetical protein
MTSSSSGSTRGSAGSGIAFDVESRGVAARDARVEPEHDVSTRGSTFPPVGMIVGSLPHRFRPGSSCSGSTRASRAARSVLRNPNMNSMPADSRVEPENDGAESLRAELPIAAVSDHTAQDSAPVWVKWTPLAMPPSSFRPRMTAIRRSGGTMNIMNPPPPAPETLPPIAPSAKAR